MIGLTQLDGQLHSNFVTVTHNMNQIPAFNEACQGRLGRFRPCFIRLARQRPGQAKYFPWIGKSQNEGFPIRGRREELYAA
jgi:hypothetical protein